MKKNNHPTNPLIADMYRYAYWIHLDKKTALQIVAETLNGIPEEELLNFDENNFNGMDMLKLLQLECEQITAPASHKQCFYQSCKQKLIQKIFHQDEDVMLQSMRTLLEKLPVTERAILALHYIWGLDAAQIAEILAISEHAAELGLTAASQKIEKWS